MPVTLKNILVILVALGVFAVLITIGAVVLGMFIVLVLGIVFWRKAKAFFGGAAQPRYEDAMDVDYEIVSSDDEGDNTPLK